jgi:hypothetical protein
MEGGNVGFTFHIPGTKPEAVAFLNCGYCGVNGGARVKRATAETEESGYAARDALIEESRPYVRENCRLWSLLMEVEGTPGTPMPDSFLPSALKPKE